MGPKVRIAVLSLLIFSSAAAFLLTLQSPPQIVHAAPPLPGAIFTTNVNGTRVNQNHFNDKCDVYLDGGPGENAPQGAAGLPDGDYYFQVTDPSGKKLLSTDPVVNRQIHVANGIITGNSGLGNHLTGVDVDHGAATIQLCPYLDTPNPGGVYKVWVTPIGDFVGDPNLVDNTCGRGCFHGFVPAASKTDNYKVKSTNLPCLGVNKFHQVNVDKKIQQWPVLIFGPDGEQINGIIYTNWDLECLIFNLEPGTYRIVEGRTKDSSLWQVTANVVDGVFLPNPDWEVSIRVRSSDGVRTVLFGNRELPGIAGPPFP